MKTSRVAEEARKGERVTILYGEANLSGAEYTWVANTGGDGKWSVWRTVGDDTLIGFTARVMEAIGMARNRAGPFPWSRRRRPDVAMVGRGARAITNVPGLSRTAFAFLLLIAGFAGPGLAFDPGRPFGSYLRTRFSNADGLASGIVHDIVQSQDGFLWLSAGAKR